MLPPPCAARPATRRRGARRGRWQRLGPAGLCGLLLLPLLPLLLLGLPGPAAGAAMAQRLSAARDAAGVDPHRGLAALQALRADAGGTLPLAERLAIDEAECRVLADVDNARARTVAEAGLAVAGSEPPAAARSAWLRLRACRAGVLVELGEVDAGRGELDQLLAATADPADAGAHALALLERGVQRSRSGDLQGGQRDLLPACEALKAQGQDRDEELCLAHLATLYRRVGDLDEAIRLQQQLRDRARRKGATYDESIYTYALAQVQQAQRQWSDAFESYRQATAASEKLGDRPGAAYAAYGMARSLLQLKRAGEALPFAERALELLDRTADPRQYEHACVTRAEALIALDRSAEARAALDEVGPAIRQRGEQALLAEWLVVNSRVQRALGRWPEAYQALAEARDLEGRLQDQRLSEQSARLRMQFNRQRDADDLSALRQLNAQGQRLRRTQAVALGLFVILLAGLALVAVRKVRQARRLQNLAATDELTGLPNRRALVAAAETALAQARRSGAPTAMLMIDVDHFKRINDTHGHAFGDEVLRHLGRVLTAGLRDHDRLGRLGGEEFLAVLPEATREDARRVAERMRAAVAAAPLPGPGTGGGSPLPVTVTVSIGVAAGLDGTADALIARADAAMYRAKHAGRNAVAVDDAGAGPSDRPGNPKGPDNPDSPDTPARPAGA